MRGVLFLFFVGLNFLWLGFGFGWCTVVLVFFEGFLLGWLEILKGKQKQHVAN